MAQINVLVAVDGATLAQRVKDGSLSAGSKNAPTSLGSYTQSDVYISMIAQHDYAANQGSSELTITANSSDLVVWTITTFGNNSDYTAFLYGGNFNPSSAMAGPIYANTQVAAHLPDSHGTINTYINHIYTATGIVAEVGVQIQYSFSFELIDNKDGSVIGYFMWDPFIQVNKG